MTRGNQRDLARAKNMKKASKKAAGEQDSNKGLTLEQRKQRDADRMREKQQLKKQQEGDGKVKQGFFSHKDSYVMCEGSKEG